MYNIWCHAQYERGDAGEMNTRDVKYAHGVCFEVNTDAHFVLWRVLCV
jgi:hypothetical protein